MKKFTLKITILLLLTSTAFAADKSEGDNTCIYSWGDQHGFCGSIEKVTSEKYKIEIKSINCGAFGCRQSECSGGQHVGYMGISVGATVWVPKWCDIPPTATPSPTSSEETITHRPPKTVKKVKKVKRDDE